MQLGMGLAYTGGFKEAVDRVVTLEKAGLDVVWVAEAYGFDAPTFMGYLAARTERLRIGSSILPIYSRTPALMAQTAAGLDYVSDGRAILGIGASGPQVIEGWHGVDYDRPLARTREMIDICRRAWRRERLTNDGLYPIPLPEGQGTGLGKPLKLITHPVRERIPIFVASIGSKNVELTAEVAEGWLPMFFIPEKAKQVWGEPLAKGMANRESGLGPLEIAAGGLLAVGEDVEPIRDQARPMVALYIGGMGAKGRNFYNNLARRYGFEREAEEIQDLYLAGKKEEAAGRVPDELLELTNLVGPEGYVRERLSAYREAGLSILNVTPVSSDPVRLIDKVKGWLG
jgi:F420-dependent oxidoreductase-like protein